MWCCRYLSSLVGRAWRLGAGAFCSLCGCFCGCARLIDTVGAAATAHQTFWRAQHLLWRRWSWSAALLFYTVTVYCRFGSVRLSASAGQMGSCLVYTGGDFEPDVAGQSRSTDSGTGCLAAVLNVFGIGYHTYRPTLLGCGPLMGMGCSAIFMV